MTSAIDRKSAKVEKPHPYRVKTRVTSEENLSRNKTKESAASDETPKKTKAAAAKKEAAEPAAAAATSTKTKTKEAKKKSRDAKSLTKRVAKILTGSSRSQAEARPSHDDVSSASAQTSSAKDASVTSREGDDVTELGKWPFNIRFVRTVSLKRKPFERGGPLRSSAPSFVGTGREVSCLPRDVTSLHVPRSQL